MTNPDMKKHKERKTLKEEIVRFNALWKRLKSHEALGDWLEQYDKKDFEGLSDLEWHQKANDILEPILEKYGE